MRRVAQWSLGKGKFGNMDIGYTEINYLLARLFMAGMDFGK
jgi:hypothetical protein